VNQQETTTKPCCKCHQIKLAIEFSKDKTRSNGYNNFCKSCSSQKRHVYYLKNKEKELDQHKQYYLKNKEYYKIYYMNNRQRCRNSNKHFHLKNPDYNNIYQKQRYRNDNIFKLIKNLRRIQHKALKNNQKSGHTIDLLMCTVEEWKKHLETQFKEGMSWDNYGKNVGEWSVDHIIPCSFFDMNDPVEQYMCFRWENTKPMWHIDNIKKGNKMIHKMINN